MGAENQVQMCKEPSPQRGSRLEYDHKNKTRTLTGSFKEIQFNVKKNFLANRTTQKINRQPLAGEFPVARAVFADKY